MPEPFTAPDPAGLGLPSVEALQAMANAVFSALPGGSSATPPPFLAGQAGSFPTAAVPAAPPSLPQHGHAPALGGLGVAPPSAPVPPLPLPARTVPVTNIGPSPFPAIPATPDPNLASIGSTAAGPSGTPYLVGIAEARPAFTAQPIPALDRSLPQASDLKALLAGSARNPGVAGHPAPQGASAPYFLAGHPAPSVPAAAKAPAPAAASVDVNRARRDVPILAEIVNGKPLVWLDNAATTHKPRAVIDRLSYFYEHENSNIHRAAHTLAGRATDAYEGARETVRRFIGAGSVEEIVFVRGTTEAINLVADTWGRANIGKGDEIVITWLEHHANIVPWHRLAAATGATLKVVPVDDNGDVLIEEYAKLLGPRVKLVSLTQVANAIGTVTPAPLMVAMAHAAGAKVLVDGAQSVSHMRTDVKALDADWFVFSGHKVFGPTGIGALYGKASVLAEMPPYQSGGNMIADVTFERIAYQPPPALFEAGTGNIADAVGLGAALDWIESFGMEAVAAHEHALIEDCVRQLKTVPGAHVVGNPRERAGVVSFVMDGMDTPEVGKALSRDGIAVRSGHHCAQPILRRFGLEASVRPSFAVYNTHGDIDALIRSLRGIRARGL